MTGERLFGVVPAAGVGSRMGSDCPKQYLTLEGLPLLHHSLGALLRHPGIDSVAVALHPEDHWADTVPILADHRVIRVAGGAERADSVLAGLDALVAQASDRDWVLVHDAARPCLSERDLQDLIKQVIASGTGAILAQPVVDTLKRAEADAKVSSTVDRTGLWRAQTPQMFRFGALRESLRQALSAGLAITDEASAMEWAGHPVQLVEGSPSNLKVTVADDLALAAFYLAQNANANGSQDR